jgi:hypothetical protein
MNMNEWTTVNAWNQCYEDLHKMERVRIVEPSWTTVRNGTSRCCNPRGHDVQCGNQQELSLPAVTSAHVHVRMLGNVESPLHLARVLPRSAVFTLLIYRVFDGEPSSAPNEFIWNSWWTNWHWSGFSSMFLRVSPLIIILPLRHTHLSPSPELSYSSGDAAPYHKTLVFKLGASSHTERLSRSLKYFRLYRRQRRILG